MLVRRLLVVLGLIFFQAASASLHADALASGRPASNKALIRDLLQCDPLDPKAMIDLQVRLQTALEGDFADKRVRRGLKELERVTRALVSCGDRPTTLKLSLKWQETAAALSNLERSPVPEKVDFFQTPWFFIKRLNRPVGQGKTPSNNVQNGGQSDPSRFDPSPSTFWHRPKDLPAENLYYGFNRTNFLLTEAALCTYAGPKESFGRNPGFSVELQGARLKLKFAEISSEPFAARIFSALGYFADPTDYVPGVRLAYSRAMLREFNSRKPLSTKFTFLGLIPLFTLQLQQHYDPFGYIARAVLTNGAILTGSQLKQRLLLNPAGPNPEATAANFNVGVESAIAYLETVPANVQIRIGKSIGPWDFGQLDHASRRELRGAALLAGWLGWFDTRFDNTRLRVVKQNGKPELQHVFSDLGGVLGQTRGLLYARGELPNAFPWRFTREPKTIKSSEPASPFPLSGYKPIAPTPAFAEMTFQDARWMARLIGSLTERQLTQALLASGFHSAQARLYLEKLVSRRDHMIVDLQLENEIPLLRSQPQDQQFCYDPASAGPVTALVDGKLVRAPVGCERIVNGKVRKKR